MNNLYVIAKQTVIEMEGQPNELGYTLYDGTALFKTCIDAQEAIRNVGLPLGWVVIRLQQIIPQLDAAVTSYVRECIKVAEEYS